MKKILVTGMSGRLGTAVRRKLERTCRLTALNRREVSGIKCYQADISNLYDIRPAFEGQETVVHLAARSGRYTWEEVHRINVVGTYNVFKAACDAGVKRVVYASSGAAVSGWERESPYREIAQGRYDEVPEDFKCLTHESPTRPSGLYGATKIWGEAAARHFTDTRDISIICLRFGSLTREDRPMEPRQFSVWCSVRDAVQMIEKCITAPEQIRYDIFFVQSDNKWSYRDLTHARDAVGFTPQDRAEDHRPRVS